jgi:hypothetical protein
MALSAAVHDRAVLRFDYTAASPSGGEEELGPDRCRLVLGSWSWPGLAADIGRFDADIEVVGPAELRDAFARLARRYAGAATEAPGPVSGEESAKL